MQNIILLLLQVVEKENRKKNIQLPTRVIYRRWNVFSKIDQSSKRLRREWLNVIILVKLHFNRSFYRKIFMEKSYQPIHPTSNRILQKKWDEKYYSDHKTLVNLSLSLGKL